MKQFEIFLNGYKVGDFNSTNYEFPSIQGNFVRQKIPDESLQSQLDDWVNFCIQAEEIAKEYDYSYEYDDFWLEHEDEHLYLIDEAQWTAKAPDKEPFSITIPIFYSENEINFR